MQTLGIIDISWKGKNIPVEKGAKVRLAGYKNNNVITGRRVDYAEEYQPGEATATTKLARGERLTDLYSRGSGELIAVCDTGQTFTWTDAFMEQPPEVTGGEGGKAELKWTFGEGTELLNG